MKLNKDNYELVMFDLLEGNLSENDAIQVMGDIEGDEFFFNEWKHFKSTVLIADKDVVYTNKTSLMKKEDGFIAMFNWKTAAVAASLFLAAVIIVPRLINSDTTSVATEVTEAVQPGSNELEEIVLAEETKSEVATNQPVPLNSAVKYDAVSKRANFTPHVKKEATPFTDIKEQIVNNKPVVPVEYNDEPEQINPVPETKDVLDQNPLNSVVVNNFPTIESSNTNIPEKSFIEKMDGLVTSNPKDRIRDRISNVVNLVRNPELRLKPNFKGKPSLDIELETRGYQAVASITPFKQ